VMIGGAAECTVMPHTARQVGRHTATRRSARHGALPRPTVCRSGYLAGQRVAGRILPVRHYGRVDVFLEAFGRAEAGDVLVVDNGGRVDEACVGDLAVLEANSAGVAGLVVWGLHRDSRSWRCWHQAAYWRGSSS
jgi:regulator of RNase E activity RraA